MIDLYDLYDLHFIIVRIRYAPENTTNCEILTCVIDVLKTGVAGEWDSNQIRKAIHNVVQRDKSSLYSWLLTENKYSFNPLSALKDLKVYAVLTEACEELLATLNEGNNQKVYDLADTLHNLPLFIVEYKYHIPHKFWKEEIKMYRKKWDHNFLKHAEKAYRVSSNKQ